MQRLLATLLLSVIGFLPIAPAFASATPNVKLPECCRANGKHHCQMRSAQSGGEPALYLNCSACPFSSNVGSTASNSIWVPVALAPIVQQLVSCRIAAVQTDVLLTFSFEHSGQKRGPPSRLA